MRNKWLLPIIEEWEEKDYQGELALQFKGKGEVPAVHEKRIRLKPEEKVKDIDRELQ